MVPLVRGISISLKTGIRNKNTRAALVEIKKADVQEYQQIASKPAWGQHSFGKSITFWGSFCSMATCFFWYQEHAECVQSTNLNNLPALLTVNIHWKLLWMFLEMHVKSLDWGQWPQGTELCQPQPPPPTPGQAQGSELCSPGNYSHCTRTRCLWGRGKKKVLLDF